MKTQTRLESWRWRGMEVTNKSHSKIWTIGLGQKTFLTTRIITFFCCVFKYFFVTNLPINYFNHVPKNRLLRPTKQTLRHVLLLYSVSQIPVSRQQQKIGVNKISRKNEFRLWPLSLLLRLKCNYGLSCFDVISVWRHKVKSALLVVGCEFHQHFHKKVFFAAFLCLQFGFVIFC